MITRKTQSGKTLQFIPVTLNTYCSMCYRVPESGRMVLAQIVEARVFYFCRACCRAIGKAAEREPVRASEPSSHRNTPVKNPNAALEGRES